MNNFFEDFEPIKIVIHGVRLPTFTIEEKYYKELSIDRNSSNYDFLRALCLTGFKKLNLKKDTEDYKKYSDRVKYELELLNELGFVDYILLVWDVINFCKEKDIPVGRGRGSSGGSLVLYLIGVIKIDPIKYELYFERFISKIRAKKTIIDGVTFLDGGLAPDIDVDACFYRRSEILDYLKSRFPSKICKIPTFNSFSSKLLIKDVAKTFGMMKEEDVKKASDLIKKNFGILESLEESYNNSPEFKEWSIKNQSIYDIAIKLNGLIKNRGVHPSALLISYDPLSESCPVELSSDKEHTASFDMNWCASFAIKLDVLGLRAVSVVDDACKNLGIKMNEIDINDPIIYQYYQDFKHPHGLFQIEASLCSQTIQKVKPKNLEELSAVLSLARPGALQFIDQYAKFSNGGEYEPIHPFFDKVLKETAGVCIYQESLMKLINLIGFTLDEAETCRKIVGKKQLEKVKEWEQKIKDKVKENNLDPQISDILFKILDDSSKYSFNKSHGFCYSSLSATTTYIKSKYPLQFFLSLLKMTKNEPDPIGEISKIHPEMEHFGIKLLPPSLTHSQMDFSIEGKDIRFGLSSIKKISDAAINKINNFKKDKSNKFEIFEAAKEAGLNTGQLGALIQAGALTTFGASRTFMVYECQLWNVLTEKEKQAALTLAPKMNFHLVDIVKHINKEVKNEKGKPLIKDSRYATIKKATLKPKDIFNKNKNEPDLANWWYEKTLTGFVSSKKLIDIFLSKTSDLEPVNQVLEAQNDSRVSFVGTINEKAETGTSKKGSKYGKFLVGDETGSIKVMIFNERWEQCKDLNAGNPKEEDIVIVKGVKKEEVVFADLIAVQNRTIYTELMGKETKEAKEVPLDQP